MTIDNRDNRDNHIKFLKKIPQNIRKPQWRYRTFAVQKQMKNERVKSEKLNAPSIEARCSKVQTPTHQGARWDGPKMQNTKYKI